MKYLFFCYSNIFYKQQKINRVIYSNFYFLAIYKIINHNMNIFFNF